MATIERKDVERVAELARIALDEEEIDLFAEQLGQVLAMARALAEAPTDGVEPTAHVVPLANVTRPDRARPSLPKEKVLANAPDVQDGYFRVPKILEDA